MVGEALPSHGRRKGQIAIGRLECWKLQSPSALDSCLDMAREWISRRGRLAEQRRRRLFDFGQCRWCLETRGVKAMTDGSHLDDPEYWRDRAAQVRAL